MRNVTEKSSLPIVINLDSPDGNAMYLMTLVRRISNQLGQDGKAIFNQMLNQDYYQNLAFIERKFQGIIQLETDNQSMIDKVNEINIKSA